MGKTLVQQARGKGGPKYLSLGFRSVSAANHVPYNLQGDAEIVDIIKCPNHFAPLIAIKFGNDVFFNIAGEGMCVGQKISNVVGEAKLGNTLKLRDISEGVDVFNIELKPGDGGKFVRCPGTSAKLQSKDDKFASVIMPSKKLKLFNLDSRATIGVVAGAGRLEKPILKAGVAYFKAKAKHQVYPKMSGSAQNAVDHPFGNKRTSRKSHAKPAPHNAPPGRNVGMIRPRRTGRKK